MMNPTKASKILSDYARNNFNAYKTLVENGYSKKTALKHAGRTIQTANDIARKALNIPIANSKSSFFVFALIICFLLWLLIPFRAYL